MERTTPTLLREAETPILALCEDHLTREETLLADMLHSLRQVRDAFCQRNLSVLPTLQSHQDELTRQAAEMTAARDRLRAALADLLGIAPQEATLRAAALPLDRAGTAALAAASYSSDRTGAGSRAARASRTPPCWAMRAIFWLRCSPD